MLNVAIAVDVSNITIERKDIDDTSKWTDTDYTKEETSKEIRICMEEPSDCFEISKFEGGVLLSEEEIDDKIYDGIVVFKNLYARININEEQNWTLTEEGEITLGGLSP